MSSDFPQILIFAFPGISEVALDEVFFKGTYIFYIDTETVDEFANLYEAKFLFSSNIQFLFSNPIVSRMSYNFCCDITHGFY